MKTRVLGKILGAILFFFFTGPSRAEIISLKIRSQNRDIIGFSTFEFSDTGYVSVAISSVAVSSVPVTSNLSQPDPSRIGFFLVPDELSYDYNHEFKRNPNLCPLGNNSISVLFNFTDLSLKNASFNKTHHVPYPGEYSLYFANCNDGQTVVTMDVRTELYNTDDDGTSKDYLSAGQPQPSVCFKLSLIYLCFLGFWISISRNKCLFRIHLLMGVLLVTTIILFLCAMEDQGDLKVTGIHHGSWHTLVHIVQLVRNVVFFTVILLISTGWCFWKPVLKGFDRFGVTMVILLQVWASVRGIKVRESGPYNEDWQGLLGRFRLIDFIGCVVVILHPIFAVATLKEDKDEMLAYGATSGRRLSLCLFPIMVVGLYIYYSRGLRMNILLGITVPLEIGNLVFTMVMFYMYRPLLLEDEVLYSKGFLPVSEGHLQGVF